MARVIGVYRQEKKRQEVAELCVFKLREIGKTVPYVSMELSEARNFNIALFSSVTLSIGFSCLVFKKLIFRLPASVCLIMLFVTNANQYRTANIVEEIAEYPTDYGQAVRAVLIFKNNEGPKTGHYEELSEQYRKYLKKKSLSS